MTTAVRGLHPLCLNTSTYSTLSSAVPGASLPPRPKHHFVRTRVPPRCLLTPPGWRASWPHRTVVTFESLQRPRDVERGVTFSDAKKEANLVDGRSPAFPASAQAHIELRVSWPGYRHLERTYHIAIYVQGRPITRLELAKEVVKCYERFFSHARQGHYAGTTENGSWEITNDFFAQSRLVLRAVANTHGNDSVFQAEIDIVTVPSP
ncbi:hypothetical protein BV20DRAFT_179992 [Pilatotrama ljubarskyi]|nr:hypothetical protein BV20DRAFT_179992 [Pilatotrama ljubarskyi]